MDSRAHQRTPAAFLVSAILVVLILAFLPAGTQQAKAASGWAPQNSGTPNGLQCISAVNSNIAWAAGAAGTVLRTTDGGATWESKPLGLAISLSGIAAVDANTAWVVGNVSMVPTIWKTTDGGRSWNVQFTYVNSQVIASIVGLTAANANTAWAIGMIATPDPYSGFPPRYNYACVILKTSDGSSWSANYSEATLPGARSGISAVDANTVWANAGRAVLKTTNGGASWSSKGISTYSVQSVDGVDANTAWAADDYGSVYRTSDGGANWNPVLSLSTGWSNYLSVSAVSANSAWVAGDSGSIYKTNDGGTRWLLQLAGAPGELYSVSAVDGNTAWAVGAGGMILHTTDGGGTATLPKITSLNPTQSPGGRVVTVSGLGFGDTQGSSYVSFGPVRATDYTSWSYSEIKVIVPLGATTGPVTVTTSIGNSKGVSFTVTPWYRQRTTSDVVTFYGICAIDTLTAWACGRSTVVKTSDGGATWVSKTAGLDVYDDFMAMTNYGKTVWMGGYGDVGGMSSTLVCKSTDGGESWSRYNTLPGSLNFGQTLSAVDNNNLWAGGAYDTGAGIMKSSDGGATWSASSWGTENVIIGVSGVDANSAWALGYYYYPESRFVLRTTDGGRHLVEKTPSSKPWITGLAGINANTALATVGYNDGQDKYAILKTTDGGTNWSTLISGTGFQLNNLCVLDAKNAWATGFLSNSRGSVVMMKTTDGGATWSRQDVDNLPLDSGQGMGPMAAVDLNVAWSLLSYADVLHTTDGGAGRPMPHLTSIEPAAGSPGSEVVIKGSGFWGGKGSSYVNFGSVKASDYTLWSDMEIRCKVPPVAPGNVSVTVTNMYATSNALPFTAGVSTGPKVTAINPASGVNNANYAVEVLGSGFQSDTAVRLERGSTTINGVGVYLASPGRLTCYLDLNGKPLGKYDVVVKNKDGQESRLTGGFAVTDICGQGAGASISIFVATLGLMSFMGIGFRRRWKGTQP